MFPNGLVAAMEEIENNVPVTDNQVAEEAVVVADESAEIQQTEDEVGTSVSQIEAAVQDGEELESIAEVASDAVESGEGLTKESAELASIAIESIRRRVGIHSGTRAVPATESFGNSNTRLTSTKMIVEAISFDIKKIWAAIKAAFIRVVNKIRGFLSSLFKSTSMLNNYINSLTKRANGVPSGAVKKEEELNVGLLTKNFSVGGKADFGTAKEIVENTKVLAQVATRYADGSRAVGNAAVKLADDLTQEGIKTFLKSEEAGKQAVVSTAKSLSVMLNVPKMPGVENTYGPFINGKVLVVKISNKQIFGADTTSFSLQFENMNASAAKSAKALSIIEIKEALTIASELVKLTETYKKADNAYGDIAKQVSKLSDTIISHAEKISDKDDEETKTGLKELKTFVNNSMKGLNSFGQIAPASTFQCARALADYASASLRNLGDKPVEKK